jgi:hypothetical protein
MSRSSRAAYRTFSLGLAVVFAAVGGVFLLLPGRMLAFFNSLSRGLGMIEGPTGSSFFVALAGAYMYVVTILAWRMFRSPEERIYPRLLVQAKLASAALSFLLFTLLAPWLIFLVNGVVDGALGVAVLARAPRPSGAPGGAR